MTAGRQIQRAGEGSNQYQAQNITVYQGVTEDRAREIALLTARRVVEEYSTEGHALIQSRIDELDQRVIEGLSKAGTLDAFADPAFQRTYRKAQNGAAASERESDYDMLAGLLKERADRPAERPIIAGIERAIEIVDLVDEDALRGLTLLNAVVTVSPNAPEAKDGLDYLDRLFEQLIDGPLPVGSSWMDHLDLLDATRLNTSSQFRPFDEFYPELMNGYVCPGVQKDHAPEFLQPPLDRLPWQSFLIDHAFKPGFLRMRFSNEATVRGLLSGDDPQLLEQVLTQAKVMVGFDGVDQAAATAFVGELQKRPSLSKVREWWMQFPHHLEITAVGRTLARANAYRLDADSIYPRD